jgi:hypothetical protein
MASKIDVQGKEITIITRERQDYISLTDIAKYGTATRPRTLSRIGCVAGAPSSFWGSGSN